MSNLSAAHNSTYPYYSLSNSNKGGSAMTMLTDVSKSIFSVSRILQSVKRTTCTLSVSQTFTSHYVLIKGLLEFSRPKNIKLNFDRASGTIEVDLDRDQTNLLSDLLHRVGAELLQELNFRKSLKKVIETERRYQAEIKNLYNQLMVNRAL